MELQGISGPFPPPKKLPMHTNSFGIATGNVVVIVLNSRLRFKTQERRREESNEFGDFVEFSMILDGRRNPVVKRKGHGEKFGKSDNRRIFFEPSDDTDDLGHS
mmetsp:Transcript_13470/g.31961  ORF Transcript_13470/g.31961 Transcript_13470/m.31961 type:complete len:104 (+) Transcript_13470:276-587(+)